MPGIGNRRNAPGWSEADAEYLRAHWGTMSEDALARKLNRSVGGVRGKAYAMHLGPFVMASDCVSLRTLWKLLNPQCGPDSGSSSQFIDIWRRHGAKISYRQVTGKCRVACMTLDDFWEFARANPELVHIDRLPRGTLGVEPDWAEARRRQETRQPRLPPNTRWTPEEDARLESMLKEMRWTVYDIARALGRTPDAVRQRMVTRGHRLRPIPVPPTRVTKAELDKAEALVNEGYSLAYAAACIDRTPQTIRYWLEKRKARRQEAAESPQSNPPSQGHPQPSPPSQGG